MDATLHGPGEGLETRAVGNDARTQIKGWEHYMRDLAEAARSGPMTTERIGEVASRYDIEVV